MPGDADFGTQITHSGFGLAHGGLSQAELGWRHLERPAALSPPGSRCGQPCFGAFDDQFALKFGKSCKNAEDQATVRRAGVNCRTFARQYLQTDLASGEFGDGIDQVSQIATKSIQLPDDECVVGPKRLQASIKSWAIVAATRCTVLIDLVRRDACGDERISLQVMDLRAIGLRSLTCASRSSRLAQGGG